VRRGIRVAAALSLSLWGASGVAAGDEGVAGGEGTATGETRPPLIVYVPPESGAPDETVSGGTRRGPDRPPGSEVPKVFPSLALSVPDVMILGPAHVATTSTEHPAIFLWLRRDLGDDERVSVSLHAAESKAGLETISIPGPRPRGLVALNTESRALRLAADTTYAWRLAIDAANVPEPPSTPADPAPVVHGTRIRRVPSEDEPGLDAPSDPLARARRAAAAGRWYDAFAEIQGALASDPASVELGHACRELLEQAGLAFVASREGVCGQAS
jgi:hypothetical protein